MKIQSRENARTLVLVRDGFTCFDCGFTDESGGRLLVIESLDTGDPNKMTTRCLMCCTGTA